MARNNKAAQRQRQIAPKTEASGSPLWGARLPHFLVIFLIAAWFCVVLYFYFKFNPTPDGTFESYFSLKEFGASLSPIDFFSILRFIPDMLSAAAIFAAALGFGRQILRLFKFQDTTALENGIFSILLGLIAIIFQIFIIGISGFFYKLPVLAVLAAGIACIFIPVPSRQAGGKQEKKAQKIPFEWLWFAALLFGGLVALIGALSPETFYDSLVYHIAKPNFWLQCHKIMPDLNMVITDFFPGNANLLYAAGLLLHGEIACKLTNLGFLALACLTVYAMAARLGGRMAGITGAIVYFAIPYTMLLSYRTGMEMYLAFFETVSAFGVLMWMQKREKIWIVLSGCALGLAIGTKYTAFYCAVSLCAMLLADMLIMRCKFVETIRSLFVLLGVAGVVASPWWIYNVYYTGNPIYPFLANYLGHVKPRMSADPATRLSELSRWKHFFVAVLEGPWTVSMGQYEEAFIGPVALMILPLLMLFKDVWKRVRLLLVYLALYWCIWGLAHEMYVRYFMPPMAVVCVVCGVILANAEIKKFFRNIIFLALPCIFFANTTFVMYLQKISNNCLGVVLGNESKATYLNRIRMSYPTPYYEMAEWINYNTPKNSIIMCMGELRSFYIHRRVVMSGGENYNTLIAWAGMAANGDDLAQLCRAKGITHILFNFPEAKRLSSLDLAHFDPNGLKIYSQFWDKYVIEMHRTIPDAEIAQQGIFSLKTQHPDWWAQHSASPAAYVYLYKILSPDEAKMPHAPALNFYLSKEVYSSARWAKLESAVSEILKAK